MQVNSSFAYANFPFQWKILKNQRMCFQTNPSAKNICLDPPKDVDMICASNTDLD